VDPGELWLIAGEFRLDGESIYAGDLVPVGEALPLYAADLPAFLALSSFLVIFRRFLPLSISNFDLLGLKSSRLDLDVSHLLFV